MKRRERPSCPYNQEMPRFDVVGVGLNATDTLLVVPHFPAYAGKVPFQDEMMSPGGQVASAIATCARLGLRTKYIGTVGDDERGRIQMKSLRDSDINLDHVQLRRGCANQSAYIIIDRSTGERTVLWQRPECLRIDPSEIMPEQITCARLLHIDGHDTPAVEHAARIAREQTFGLELLAQLDVEFQQCPGDAELYRIRLSVDAATVHGCNHVKGGARLAAHQRRLCAHALRFSDKVIVERTPIH